ncbi:hypothetical protein BSL78_03729 [Apostichopus japonicus]|uniref:Farnesoic acid O-methyl transferase domain-containing protein n=1 Tax=Stichopus japonicus TaxID=307972 RepID=A0A2G8LGI3_STIJA|nr:hypothetical protein BSL78_03729 [Apostichopus japonicus]
MRQITDSVRIHIEPSTTTILDFTDTRPLWISYAGFATRNGFQGDFLVYDFIYEHGTILRTFFQTNMNSHSVGTPELGSDERQLNFGLKASASGVIILSESSSLSGAHYEIDTIDILDADNYVEFWISFRSGAIRVGKVGSLEFMSWQGSLPEIRFAFFESGIHSASNIYYWFVFKYYYFSQARGGIFYTHDINQAYQYHYTELRREGGGAYIEFGIKADGEVLIALSPTKGDADGMIEIGIGALENRAIFVRDCRDCSYMKHAIRETDLVNSETERHLVITVVDGTIRVFDKEVLEADGDPLFEYSSNDLDETSFNYMGFSGAFTTHFHFHVFLPFEYKYYNIQEVGKKLHLGVTASRDACIAIAGETPDDTRLFEIVIAPEGENMIEVRTCRGCPALASYGGDNVPRIMSEAEGAKIWILVTDSEIQIGSFTIEEGNGGRTMHDGNAFLTYPNNIGLQAINFGIAVGQGVESHWLLYPYTD